MNYSYPIKHNVPFLTGIRGIAVSLVLLAHLGVFGDMSKYMAYLGMSLFFVLSGVVIQLVWGTRFNVTFTDNLRWSSSLLFLRYLQTRFARLAPLYFFVGIPYFAECIAKTGCLDQSKGLFLRFLFAVQSWWYDKLPQGISQLLIYAHSWSISSEILLYILFPIILLCLRINSNFSTGITKKFFLLTVIYLIYVLILYLCSINVYNGKGYPPSQTFIDWLVYLSPYGRIIEFCTGILIGNQIQRVSDIHDPKYLVKSYFSTIIGLISVVTLIALVFLFSNNSTRNSSFEALLAMSPIWLIPIATLLLSLPYSNKGLLIFFENPLIIRLGILSYSIYLLQNYGAQSFSSQWLPELPYWFRVAGQLVCVLLMAEGSYRLIEVPSRNWIRTLFFNKPTTDDTKIIKS